MESIKELREICQASIKDQDFIQPLQRSVSIYFTWAFLHTSITANQMTVAFIIIGIISAPLLAFSNYWIKLLGCFLLLFSVILDCVDGEIARYRKNPMSTLAAYLDIIGHKIICAEIFLAAAYSVYASTHNISFLFLGFSAAIFFILVFSQLGAVLQAKAAIIKSSVRDKFQYAQSIDIAEINSARTKYSKYSKSFIWKLLANSSMALRAPYCIIPIVLIFSVFNRMDLALYFYGVMTPLLFFTLVYINIKSGV